MAKCKSTLMSVIRGSVAGITFTANTFCSIIARARTIPTNTNTQYQQQIRACFTQAKAIWPTLTRAIRGAWDNWAATVTLMGPTGPYTVPGRQWYMGIRALVYYLTLRGISFGTASHAAPTTHGLIAMGIWTVSAPATGIGYTIEFSPITTELLTYYATRSQAFTDDRNFYSGPWESDTLIAESQLLVSDPVELERSDLVTTSIYFERIRAVSHQSPFRVSEELILRIQAQAGADAVSNVKVVAARRSSVPRAA